MSDRHSDGTLHELHVAHLSCDGILQPIGYSQVARPVLGLAARGIPHTIVSLERRADLDDELHVRAVTERLAAGGVSWRHGVFVDGGGARQYASNVGQVTALALREHAHRRIRLVVARSFLVGPAALALRALTFAPFVYDIRGFWVEQRLKTGRVPAGARNARLLRAIDAQLYQRAAALVSLTQRGIDLLEAGTYGRWDPAKPAVCIPTCVDYDEFRPQPRSPEVVPDEIRARLRDRLVVGWVGSVNADYCLAESLRLFSLVRTRRPDAILLCLTPHEREIREAAASAKIPDDALVFARPPHHEIAAWLPLLHWGLLLLLDDEVKSGSMPTKLAEFFACGVRPIHFGCNPEVGAWVRRAGSGISLDDLSEPSLATAAEAIAASRPDDKMLSEARARTEPHFSLTSGIDRYEALLRQLGSSR